MWLLPLLNPIARVALRGFYDFHCDGPAIPQRGPVIIASNHTNALLDPAAVVAVARRPVRFLAKAPLFNEPVVGWLIRPAGAIPVYRRQDDRRLLARNQETFRAAHQALREGDAIGIFPEGRSHSEPSLVPLRTGAARIALGAAAPSGEAFPIVPVGLVFRDRQRFRSRAAAIIGEPIAWADLARRGDTDAAAVRELTRRIDEGLREVTLNLARSEDAEVVLAAVQIYNAELGVRLPEREQVRALREVTLGLSRLRAGDREDWLPVARAVRLHARRLATLGLQPERLSRPGGRAAVAWTLRQTLVFGLLLLPALVGAIVYRIPYRITGAVADRWSPTPDAEAMYKLISGILLHGGWTILLAVSVGVWQGPAVAAAVALILPALGWSAVRFRERWRRARVTARSFLVRARREELVARLRARQKEIAMRLAQLRRSIQP